MSENLLTTSRPVSKAGPAPQTPEQFIDPATGDIRVDALLKSYLELERMLARMSADPLGGLDPVRKAAVLGIPETPDAYTVDCSHGLFEPDPEINAKLHASGYSQEQAQVLYDLAAERLVPMIQDIAAEFQAERELERLKSHFGGEERWREVSRQINAWAGRNLPPAAVDGLSTTFEGVMALYSMMMSKEPQALRRGGTSTPVTEADLHAIMRDPKYWRDRDPIIIARVTDGFRRLYPDD